MFYNIIFVKMLNKLLDLEQLTAKYLNSCAKVQDWRNSAGSLQVAGPCEAKLKYLIVHLQSRQKVVFSIINKNGNLF